jgi:hypothetical protein
MIFLLRNQHVVVSKRRLICCTSLCPHSHAHLAQLSALNTAPKEMTTCIFVTMWYMVVVYGIYKIPHVLIHIF